MDELFAATNLVCYGVYLIAGVAFVASMWLNNKIKEYPDDYGKFAGFDYMIMCVCVMAYIFAYFVRHIVVHHFQDVMNSISQLVGVI